MRGWGGREHILGRGEDHGLVRGDGERDRSAEAGCALDLVERAVAGDAVARDGADLPVVIMLLFDCVQDVSVCGDLLPRGRGQGLVVCGNFCYGTVGVQVRAGDPTAVSSDEELARVGGHQEGCG